LPRIDRSQSESGQVGVKSQYLFNELLRQKNGKYLSGYETRDQSSNDRIWTLDPSGLDPSLKLDIVTAFNMSEAFGDSPLRIAQGFRTFEAQEALYAQGRTTPGNIVTWARGGESNHNFGFAIDIFRIQGRTLLNPSASTVQIFKGFGFEWGGDWGKKVDRPHFQRLPPGQ
jgi:hypothetical protein